MTCNSISRTRRLVVIGALMLAGLAPSPATAEETVTGAASEGRTPAPHNRFLKLCKADAAKFCAPPIAGDGAIAECLAAKKTELAKPCLRAMRRAKRVSVFRQSCGADVTQRCGEVKTGGGRIRACLMAAEAELSPSCKELMAKAQARKTSAADLGAVADEAVTEEQQSVPVVPETVVIEEGSI
jgi:hypothetical protein